MLKINLMFKHLYLKILKQHYILKFKLFLKSIGIGSYLVAKVNGTEEEYMQIYIDYINSSNSFKDFIKLNFKKEEVEFINKLALITQVTKKSSKINFNHGFIICKYLKDYLRKNINEKIIILETGTARGFSAIIMASVLAYNKEQSEIHTIDIIPHKKKIYWNCISDPREGKLTREQLLKNYKEFLKHITFHQGTAKDVTKKLPFDRINFSFLDGAHDYADIKLEYDYVQNKNKKGDIIIFDDYNPVMFSGIVKLVHEIEKKELYDVVFLNSNTDRGYVILTRK